MMPLPDVCWCVEGREEEKIMKVESSLFCWGECEGLSLA